MTESYLAADLDAPADHSSSGPMRPLVDAALLKIFNSKRVRRSLHQHKLNLPDLGVQVFAEIQAELRGGGSPFMPDALELHRRLVHGLPGQALFAVAALAFDTLNEALPFFQITAKTAWHKLDSRLSINQSESALRLGRAAVLAAELVGNLAGGQRYLRTANFALGGVTALELLRTAAGEHLVLAELQTHADGGPV